MNSSALPCFTRSSHLSASYSSVDDCKQTVTFIVLKAPKGSITHLKAAIAPSMTVLDITCSSQRLCKRCGNILMSNCHAYQIHSDALWMCSLLKPRLLGVCRLKEQAKQRQEKYIRGRSFYYMKPWTQKTLNYTHPNQHPLPILNIVCTMFRNLNVTLL